MVICTHTRDGKLISRQVVTDDELDADEFGRAARLLFEMAYQDEGGEGVDSQSA